MTANDARDRFSAATARHLTAPLADGVTLRHVDARAWHEQIDAIWQGSQPRPGVDLRALFTPDEAARIADLDAILADRLEHRLLFESEGDVVGGYWGGQDTEGRYCMTVSVLRADWRRRGLYAALLPRVVDAATASGFREIYSRHRADNNAVLNPKLRAGFVIAAFEVAPRWGLTIHLRRYLVDAIGLVHEHRVDGAHTAALRARGLPLP